MRSQPPVSSAHIDNGRRLSAARLRLVAWQLLQRLAQHNAQLEWFDGDGRFYFSIHGRRTDLVRQSTMDALASAGMLRRERSEIAIYTINDRGRAALRERSLSPDVHNG